MKSMGLRPGSGPGPQGSSSTATLVNKENKHPANAQHAKRAEA